MGVMGHGWLTVVAGGIGAWLALTRGSIGHCNAICQDRPGRPGRLLFRKTGKAGTMRGRGTRSETGWYVLNGTLCSIFAFCQSKIIRL